MITVAGQGGFPAPDYESGWLMCPNNDQILVTHNLNTTDIHTFILTSHYADGRTPYVFQTSRAGDYDRTQIYNVNQLVIYNVYDDIKYFKVRVWRIGTLVAPTTLWQDAGGKAKALKPINANTQKISGVVDPTADQEAATKKYVDDNAGGGGAWNLIVDVGINATSHTVNGLDGNTDKIYHIILDGAENANNLEGLLRPNNDFAGGHYQNAGHEVGYYNGNNFHSYKNSNVLTGLKIIHNFTPDTAAIVSDIMLSAKTGAWRKAGVDALTTNTQNPPGVHKYNSTGVWLNSGDNITSLVFSFGNTFTGRLYIFDIG